MIVLSTELAKVMLENANLTKGKGLLYEMGH